MVQPTAEQRAIMHLRPGEFSESDCSRHRDVTTMVWDGLSQAAVQQAAIARGKAAKEATSKRREWWINVVLAKREAGEPWRWGVEYADGSTVRDFFLTREQAERYIRDGRTTWKLTPFPVYRRPVAAEVHPLIRELWEQAVMFFEQQKRSHLLSTLNKIHAAGGLDKLLAEGSV